MEISLKIELSEDQYSSLMQNSYNEIFKDPETQEQLRRVILENFTKYFSGTRDKDSNNYVATSYRGVCNFVEKALLKEVPKDTNRLSYSTSTQYEPTDFMRQLIAEATKEQRAEFEKQIQIIVKELLNNSLVVSEILKEVLLNSIINGVTLGTNMMIDQKKVEKQNQDMIYAAVHRMMNSSN